MTAINNRITLRSIEFGSPPFRKLANLEIQFAERITLIAGHNGIGKSTIQGLVANTFGIPKEGMKSYFGEAFSANIERIVYLALGEVASAQKNPSSVPTVVANVNGITVKKRCAMTKRTQWKRARVVPRTIDRANNDPVGPDAKIPLPTIFLGIKRLASIGEADEKDVASKKIVMHDDDRALMANFVSSVILGSQVNKNVTHLSIKGANKKTIQPGYAHHDAFAVSMGQDSLASIATALASFNRLMREDADGYPGGLLVIDELDVGFHPHAIDRLVKELKSQAKKLKLQIIATTHSPRLIEAIHPEGNGNKNAPDSVIYLLDTTHPRKAEDQSLTAILDDMALREEEAAPKKAKKPVLAVYLEDDESVQFCEALIPRGKRTTLGRELGVQIKLIGLGVGGNHLIGLPDKDPMFQNRVLVVDADTSINKKALDRGNTIKLPCHRGAQGTERSPENVVKIFLRKVMTATQKPMIDVLKNFSITNPSTDKLRNAFFSDDAGSSDNRDSNKVWWNKHCDKIKRWGVLEQWAVVHASETSEFVEAFTEAVTKVANRITR